MDVKEIPTGAEARLIGELIGLARGTDGSEHLITPVVTQVVAAGLSARGGDALLEALREKVLQTKREIVPGCFTCANPCGRTAPFDLSRLNEEPDSIRSGKQMLLEAVRELAQRDNRSAQQDHMLYQGLVAIGLDSIDPDVLRGLLESMHQD